MNRKTLNRFLVVLDAIESLRIDLLIDEGFPDVDEAMLQVAEDLMWVYRELVEHE